MIDSPTTQEQLSQKLEALQSLNEALREQLNMARKSIEQYRMANNAIAQAAGLPLLSGSEVTNLAVKYIPMGMHFETLMKEINSNEALTNEWENLMLLLRLSENDDE